MNLENLTMEMPPTKLLPAAVICLLLYLFLPSVDIAIPLFKDGGNSLTGADFTGASGWLTLVAFFIAALTRFIPALRPYRNLTDGSAFLLVLVTVLYACFGSPIGKIIYQLAMVQAGVPGQTAGMLTGMRVSDFVTPNVGIGFFVLAPILLLIARLRKS